MRLISLPREYHKTDPCKREMQNFSIKIVWLKSFRLEFGLKFETACAKLLTETGLEREPVHRRSLLKDKLEPDL